MNEKILYGLGGLLIGGFAGYKIAQVRLKKKYQDFADKQVEDVKRAFSKEHVVHESDIDNTSDKNLTVPTVEETVVKAEEMDEGIDEDIRKKFFRNPVSVPVENESAEERSRGIAGESYPIDAQEVGMLYDMISEMILWSDGVLTSDDMTCEKISPETERTLLPKDWKSQIGWVTNPDTGERKYITSVFYRNDKHKMDIQVCYQSQTYMEWLMNNFPTRAEEEY